MTGAHDARERILDAATTLFYAEGFTATGVDRVASAAAVGKMSIYRHFAGKDDLLVEVLRRRAKPHLDWLLPMEPLGEQGLYGAFERIARVSSRPGYRGCPFVRAALELPSDHPALKPIASYKRSLRGRVERHLRAAQVPNRREMVMQVILLIDAAATECATERRSYPAHIGRRLVESSIAANRR